MEVRYTDKSADREGSYDYRKKCVTNIFIGIIFFFIIQCKATPTGNPDFLKNNKIEVQLDSIDSSYSLPPPLNYHLISTRDTNQWLMSLPQGDTLSALLVLNRIDRNHLKKIDTLVFPDTIGIGIDLYAPFPENADCLEYVHKIILISYYVQAFAVYENGNRIRWGPASLGKQTTPTPTGLFATNWKSKRTISTVNAAWIMEWYFNIENFRGVSIHQYGLPGYPASHACIRLYKEDAYWIYHWADEWVLDQGQIVVHGTPVVIYGTYPFGQRKPWLSLANDNKVLEITPSELSSVIQEFLPLILARQAKRDSLILYK